MMTNPEVRVFKDLNELSRAAAEEFTSLAQAPPSKAFAAALSGGSTPKRFCELLAMPEFSAKIPWPRVHLFQVDERCVPPDDPRSNYRMMREAMLAAIPAVHFHRMATEEPDRSAASAQYAAEIRETLGTASGEWPRLDVIYLGMGDDGHTASLFPGTTALAERRVAVCPNYVAKLDMNRLTLTLPVLNAAKRVIFLVAGAGKAEMLRQVLRAPASAPAEYPAQLVQPESGSVTWYLDQAAAARL
ncbi:MAG TPA: 6-phosphogluconolactonase [Terriglobia bacterium]|nr:6-phosphogluconolactonase [Terriglobia bacterium]